MFTCNTIQDQWQDQLKAAVTSADELLSMLELTHLAREVSDSAMRDFKLRVPRAFVAKMQKGDVRDPLLLQVLPSLQEDNVHPDFTPNPLNETQYNPVPGVLHKYPSRVLLTLVGSCAINCRYCFRRHFDYGAQVTGTPGREAIIEYLQQQPGVQEVILSGGEPLLLDDAALRDWIDALAKVTHLTTLRVHTRMPIVIPERITDTLINVLQDTRLQVVFVTHCNHSNEIDTTLRAKMRALQRANITCLNQSVLLKGINDNTETLAALCEKSFWAGILPYYLHLLDKTKGTAHFDVDEASAKALHEQLQGRLPGYLVPKLVREVPGLCHKLWV